MSKSRTLAVEKADKWFSLYIRLKTALDYKGSIHSCGMCPFCHERPIEHCFHFFPRGNLSTRWEEINGVGSCAVCNCTMEANPEPFYAWFVEHNGQEAFDALFRKHHETAKLSEAEILDLAEKFKTKYEELGRNSDQV